MEDQINGQPAQNPDAAAWAAPAYTPQANAACAACGKTLEAGAKFCAACGAPAQPQPTYQQAPAYQQPVYGQPQAYQPPVAYQQPYPAAQSAPAGMKAVNKLVYALMAIFLGGLGVHKFIAGKTGLGVVYILFCWTTIPSIVGLVEGIIALTKPEDAQGNIYV